MVITGFFSKKCFREECGVGGQHFHKYFEALYGDPPKP
jgi:hypothetical protein